MDTFDFLKHLSNDIEIDVKFKYNEDDFYEKNNYYYLDKNIKFKKNTYYRVCNSFLFKYTNTNFNFMPVFFTYNNKIIQTVIRTSNKKFFSTNKSLSKLINVLNDKKAILYILKKYFEIDGNIVSNEIIIEYLLGKRYIDIAKKLGVSRQRIEQIAGKYVFLSVQNLKNLFKFYQKISKYMDRKINRINEILKPYFSDIEIKFIIIYNPFPLNNTNKIYDKNILMYFIKDDKIYFINDYHIDDEKYSVINQNNNKYIVLNFINKFYNFINNNQLESKTKLLFIIKYNNQLKIAEKSYLNVTKNVYLKDKLLVNDYINLDEYKREIDLKI